MVRHVVLFGAAALSSAVMVASCDDGPSAASRVGDGCTLNSDCEAGLICVFSRCHVECNDSGDCPLASDGERLRCVIGNKPEHICQLEDERDCAYHSECPGAQRCGPDGQCRDECRDDRDCVTGQICVSQGLCAEPEEVDEGSLTPRIEEGDPVTGLPCAYDSQCLGLVPEGEPELVCRDAACNYACFLSVDCEPGHRCEPDDQDPTTPGSCVPLEGTISNCIPGQQIACDCIGGPGVQICNAEGTGYLACTDEMGNDCTP